MRTSQVKQSTNYRIKLTVAVYKNKKLVYRNDMLVPTLYKRRSECRAHIRKETQHRLRSANFFLSPRIDFDLVRYTQEASSNTYLRYRIMEEKNPDSSAEPLSSPKKQTEKLTYSPIGSKPDTLELPKENALSPDLPQEQDPNIEQIPNIEQNLDLE